MGGLKEVGDEIEWRISVISKEEKQRVLKFCHAGIVMPTISGST